DRPALLKPGVPGDPHARELRHLFPPQPRRTPPHAGRQAHVSRRQPGPPAAQELGQFGPPARYRRRHSPMLSDSGRPCQVLLVPGSVGSPHWYRGAARVAAMTTVQTTPAVTRTAAPAKPRTGAML